MKKATIAPQYVFVTDQNRVFFSHAHPTLEDFAYAKVGMVIIIRLADLHYFGTQKKWMLIPAGKLGHAEIDGKKAGAFHGLPDLFAEPAARSRASSGPFRSRRRLSR